MKRLFTLFASFILASLISFQAHPDDSLSSTSSDPSTYPYSSSTYPDPYSSGTSTYYPDPYASSNPYGTDPYNSTQSFSSPTDPCNMGPSMPYMPYMPPPMPVVEPAYSINNGVITVNPDNDVQISFLATYNPYNITQSWVFNTYFDINRIETISGTPVTNPIFGNATLQWNSWGSFNSMQGTDLIFQAIVRQNGGETTLDTTQTDVRILAQGDIAPAFDTNSPIYDALMNYVNYEGKMSLVDNQIMILFNFTTEDTISGLPPEIHEMALVVNFMKTYYYSPPPPPSYPMPGMGYGAPCTPAAYIPPPSITTITPFNPVFFQTDPRLAKWWKNFNGSPDTLIEFVGGMTALEKLVPAPSAHFPFLFLQDELAHHFPGRNPDSLTQSEWEVFLKAYENFIVVPADFNGPQLYATLSTKGFRPYQLSDLPIPDDFKTTPEYQKISEKMDSLFLFSNEAKTNFALVGIKGDKVVYKTWALMDITDETTSGKTNFSADSPLVDLGYFLKLVTQ